MLLTTFCCDECGTRVEAAVSSALLHCPVCSHVLDEETISLDLGTLGVENVEVDDARVGVTDDRTVRTEAADDSPSLEEELRRIDRKWERYQRVHLFRPARGPARVPSKRRAIARVILFALPVIACLHLALTGRVLLALLVLGCAAFGISRAAAEYVMAENRELAEFRYQIERDNAERK